MAGRRDKLRWHAGAAISCLSGYAEYLARGLFIGSGVIEAGCKTVIGLRLKQSGMFWRVTGAQNVLDIRSLLENRQFGLFWEQYRKPLPKAA
jgi:hypothetical protein